MRLSVFLAKFFLFISVLILVWIPFSGKYFSSSTHALTTESFFIFYLPLYLIPFIALVLATPINKNKMIKVILSGSLIIFLFTVLIIMFQFKFYELNDQLFLILAIGRISIPLAVWFGFVHNDIIGLEDHVLKTKTTKHFHNKRAGRKIKS